MAEMQLWQLEVQAGTRCYSYDLRDIAQALWPKTKAWWCYFCNNTYLFLNIREWLESEGLLYGGRHKKAADNLGSMEESFNLSWSFGQYLLCRVKPFAQSWLYRFLTAMQVDMVSRGKHDTIFLTFGRLQKEFILRDSTTAVLPCCPIPPYLIGSVYGLNVCVSSPLSLLSSI